jgi:hypothetical protein
MVVLAVVFGVYSANAANDAALDCTAEDFTVASGVCHGPTPRANPDAQSHGCEAILTTQCAERDLANLSTNGCHLIGRLTIEYATTDIVLPDNIKSAAELSIRRAGAKVCA